MKSPTPHTMTVTVPPDTYELLRAQAERSQHSLEDTVVLAMQAALTSERSTLTERRAMLAVLEAIDTPTLWQIVQRGAETEDVLVLAALNEKRQRQDLTVEEETAAQALIREHDWAVLLRAKALAVLRARGEDVGRVVFDP